MTTSKKRSWSIDQLAKSEFFHQKLHEWELMEVAQRIDQIKGETFGILVIKNLANTAIFYMNKPNIFDQKTLLASRKVPKPYQDSILVLLPNFTKINLVPIIR